MKNGIEIEGPFMFGQSSLFVLPIEHDRETWNQHQGQIERVLDRFGLIIPEYYPPEYSHIFADKYPLNPIPPFIREIYKDRNFLFEGVAQHCVLNQKEVWVLDPAYELSFAAFRKGLDSIQVIAAIAMLQALGQVGHKIEQRFNRRISRRDFLWNAKRATALAGITLAILGSSDFLAINGTGVFAENGSSSLTRNIEGDFRVNSVASRLFQTSPFWPEGKEALLIYPPELWKRIKFYLENEQARAETSQRYSPIKTIFPSLYIARHYPTGSIDGEITRLEV